MQVNVVPFLARRVVSWCVGLSSNPNVHIANDEGQYQ